MYKKIIIKSLVFAAIFLIVNFLLDFGFKHIHNKIAKIKDKQFESYQDDLKYLLIGDSYIQSGINPAILRYSFNLSISQSGFPQNYYKLKNVVEKQKRKPENVILQADPSSFIGFRNQVNSNDIYWVDIADYHELAKEFDNKNFKKKYFIAKYFSWVGGAQMLIKRFTLRNKEKISSDMIIMGYKPWTLSFADEPPKKQKWSVKEKTDKYFGKNPPINEIQLKYFKRILDYCFQNDIGFYILRVPATKAYIDETANYFDLSKFNQRIENIVSGYSNYKGLLDYQNLLFDHPDYFVNPDHLNDKGATVLSKALDEKLNGKGPLTTTDVN